MREIKVRYPHRDIMCRWNPTGTDELLKGFMYYLYTSRNQSAFENKDHIMDLWNGFQMNFCRVDMYRVWDGREGNMLRVVHIASPRTERYVSRFLSYLNEHYHTVAPVAAFFKQRDRALDVEVYRDNNGTNTTFIVYYDTLRSAHMQNLSYCIAVTIKVLCPWLFEGGSAFTEQERALQLSIVDNPKDAETALQQALDNVFNKERLSSIRQFMSSKTYDVINVLTNNIRNNMDSINRLTNEIASLYEAMRTMSDQLEGAKLRQQNQSDEAVNEITSFITHRKDITLVDCTPTSMTILVDSIMYPVDYDQYEVLKRRGRFDDASLFDVHLGESSLVPLFDHLFSEDADCKIKMCAAFRLGNSMVKGLDMDEMGTTQGYIYNPHIGYYSCLGNYGPVLNRMLSEDRIIECIEECVSSTCSVNIHEYEPTFNRFLHNFMKTHERCIIMPDGSEMSPTEALEYFRNPQPVKQEQPAEPEHQEVQEPASDEHADVTPTEEQRVQLDDIVNAYMRYGNPDNWAARVATGTYRIEDTVRDLVDDWTTLRDRIMAQY